MKISKVSVNRPVTTFMFMLIALLIGFVSLNLLPINLYPDIEVPVALVSTNYSGAGPEEIETLITKPIEKSVSSVSDLKAVTSYSREGNSIVVVEFEYGTDMDFAALEMREKVDLVKGLLPEDASSPLVLKIDPNAQPIIKLGVSSDLEIYELQQIIEDELQSRLERIEGVASVDISGGEEQEVKIEIDQEKLNGYNLSLNELMSAIRAENLNLPGGNVKKGEKEVLVRAIGEFESIDEIKNLPIALRDSNIIRLSDLGEVSLGFKEKDTISRLNNKNSIAINITKQSIANTVKVSENVLKEVQKIRNDYNNLEITVGLDQAEFINKSIENVSNTALMGGILAVVVLYLFLRNIRSTLIVAIAIPVSIIATFALMYFGGLSINLISLGGLALGIGMLVDNSIVVLENIYRFREEGYDAKEASIEGASEVTMAVFASTMTTVAVFLPIVFVEGFTAIIFKQLSFAVVFSLLASLVVAITIVPMLSFKILKVGEVKKRSHSGFGIGKLLDLFDVFIKYLDKQYEKILNFVLRKRKTTVLIAILIFVVSIVSVGMVGGEFFPSEDEGQLSVTIEMPFGTSLEDSNEVTKKVEAIVDKIEEKEKVFTNVGSSSGFSRSAGNKSQIDVMLVDLKDRKRGTKEIVTELRPELEKIPGAKISVSASSSMGGGGPASADIEIELKGDDLDTLKKISYDFVEIVKSVEGTSEVKSDTEDGDPEARIVLNRNAASYYGVTASMLASTIETSVEGKNITTFKTQGDEIDVNLSINDKVKDSIESIKQILITTTKGEKIPVSQIASIEYGNSPTQIARINQTRVVTISSQLSNRDLRSVTKDIEEKLKDYNIPNGYSYKFSGSQEDMAEAFSSLLIALVLSIIIVYMILASQFESLIHPFTVMLSVPFALSGGFIALFITGRALSVPAFIGVIMLSGIVVNNAIVLVDYINKLRESGYERKEAIIKAGFTRFRPILMTTMTTILGLLPLALGIGDGAATQAPMATVVIGGLLLSTLLTLAFIPVVYSIFDDLVLKFKKRFLK
ncbi:MAG: efflux RND transporter permease subunit [Peptostreptococcaceae bacterium]|jgi:HAE1 family hydrophobic/amphiphilic exporter-1|nr:efflux RND transporter permease subunit [Peptostreptococcaceae bacterium]